MEVQGAQRLAGRVLHRVNRRLGFVLIQLVYRRTAMSKRDEYAARMKQQIDETNQAIDELERKAAKAGEIENIGKALKQSFNYFKSQL
jgi:hypothetical protein